MSNAADAELCARCGCRLGPHGRAVPWWHLHRRAYEWTLAWAYRPSASVALFVLSFAESSFFPVPPDVLLMPLTLGNRRRWFRYATLCSLASVLGGVFGYCIGWLLWQSPLYVLTALLGGLIGTPSAWPLSRQQKPHIRGILFTGLCASASVAVGLFVGWFLWRGTVAEFFFRIVPGFTHERFDGVSKAYEQWNFWIVFTAGFTPLPFKLITITAGVFKINFAIFLIAAAVSRSARFFLVAGLCRIFGARITPFIDRYFNWLALAFAVLLVGGFVVAKYAF